MLELLAPCCGIRPVFYAHRFYIQSIIEILLTHEHKWVMFSLIPNLIFMRIFLKNQKYGKVDHCRLLPCRCNLMAREFNAAIKIFVPAALCLKTALDSFQGFIADGRDVYIERGTIRQPVFKHFFQALFLRFCKWALWHVRSWHSSRIHKVKNQCSEFPPEHLQVLLPLFRCIAC